MDLALQPHFYRKPFKNIKLTKFFCSLFCHFPPHFAAKNANFSPVLHHFYDVLRRKINSLHDSLSVALIIFRQQIQRFEPDCRFNPCCNGFSVATVRKY